MNKNNLIKLNEIQRLVRVIKMNKGILLNIGIIFLAIQLIVIPYSGILLILIYIILSIPHLKFLPNNTLVGILSNVTVVVILFAFTLALIFYPFHFFARTKSKREKFRKLIKWHIYPDKIEEKIVIFKFLLFTYVFAIICIVVANLTIYFNLIPAP